MRAYATRMLKDRNDFSVDNIRIQEPSSVTWTARMIVYQGRTIELFPKEIASCSMATD